ncbi:MAG: antirestriction protein ArdC [Sphingomonadaceae bacterium]|nr:antirestriction protein ArdC [Sphingomonadaceae bacterium]
MARGKSKVRGGGRRSRAARSAARGGGSRASIYDEVTATIISQLEEGVFPWVRPWSKAKASLGLPRNAVTKRAYSGINILVLWGAVIEGGYPSQDWLTFRQAQAAGGCVRKGERGRTVFYADRFTPKDADNGQGREQGESGEEVRSIPFLKRFTVFNAAQCDGIPEGLVTEPAPLPERELHRAAEDLIAATGADFRIGGAQAYYSPSGDFVMVPPQPAFHHQIDYYRTALHELGHWTGHGSRLGRDQTGRFGSAPYAREELVAELASAFLCAALGIEPTVRHADYLGNWLEVLRADSRAIFRAASQASKAAEFLLRCEPSEREQAA